MLRLIMKLFQPDGGDYVREITTEQEWEDCVEQSKSAPVLVLKHSTRCGISASAYNRVLRYLEEQSEAPETFLVKVVEHRPVSNRIAADTGVSHASPQMLLLHNAASVWDASHHGINGERIDEALHALN